MEEPPDEDGCGEEEEAEGLIADEGAALGEAAFVLSELFAVGLDASRDHGGA